MTQQFSEAQFREYGPRVLQLLSAAPKAIHDELLRKVDDGATTREIEQEVKSAREKAGIKVAGVDEGQAPPARTTAATVAAAEARAAAKKAKEVAAVTFGFKTETCTAKFVSRGVVASAKGNYPKTELSDEVALAIHTAQPFATIDGINGVKLYIALRIGKDNQLEARIEPKRDAEDELSLIHISEPTRPCGPSRMPSSA